MKITIINPSPDEEEEIIIKCRVLTDDINHLICKLKNGDRKITGYDAKGITLLALPDIFYFEATDNKVFAYGQKNVCNGVQREHNKKLNNGLPILHKVPPKRDYGRYFCIMAEKGGTSHGGLTEKLSLFFHAKKQEVNAYGR